MALWFADDSPLPQSTSRNRSESGRRSPHHTAGVDSGLYETCTSIINTFKQPHRWRPGTVAFQEIRKYQKTSELLIAKAPFERLIRKILQDYVSDIQVQKNYFGALQAAADAYLVKIFDDSKKLTIKSKRVTIKPDDIKMVLELRGEQPPQ